jgi:hypothetical protein
VPESKSIKSAKNVAAREGLPQVEAAYFAFSDVQLLLPHLHSNIWKVRPDTGSSMLVVKLGASPHFEQSGDTGFCRP